MADGEVQNRGLGLLLRRPGWREAAVFAFLVFVGFVVWFATSPGATSMLFGVNLCLWNPRLPLITMTQIVLGAVALTSGFASPRGFSLWGVALAFHSPFTHGLSIHLMEREGVRLVGGTQGLVVFGLFTAVAVAFVAACNTMLSSIGMVLRLLARQSAR